ncbi:MAG: type II toxin-antitoxin system RelE/ParE family toxin [Candidatus Promineifilaceae bacterium]
MDEGLRLQVYFFKTASGKQPVRDWLKALPEADRRIIGNDLKTAQFGWPLGMPLIRKLETDLWEVRSRLPNRTARVLFTVEGDRMILLHGFIKKSQKTAASDLKLAKQRLKLLRE